MADPFVKLYKKMLKWEWYDDINTCRLFIHCLLKANWEPTKWHGVEIEPGQFITSLASLAKETKLTVRQVRVALDHLNMTGEVTSECHSKFRVITVNGWNCYQGNDKQRDKQVTNRRQADDKQVTTVKEYKELKEREEVKNIYGEYHHVKLTDSERSKLVSEFGESKTLEAIKFLDEYIEMKGYKARSHYLAIRKWVFDAVEEQRRKNGSGNTAVIRQDEEQRNAEIDRYLESDEYKQLVGTEADMPFL